ETLGLLPLRNPREASLAGFCQTHLELHKPGMHKISPLSLDLDPSLYLTVAAFGRQLEISYSTACRILSNPIAARCCVVPKEGPRRVDLEVWQVRCLPAFR